jgi:murein DD-endopeptidase MepM/ murein hydrolase activator NlpD
VSVSKFGGLLLDIQANTASLKRDMETNTRTLQSAAGKMDSIAKGIGAAIGAYVGMASVRAFGRFVQGALDSADSLQKMSAKTGIAVETLSGLGHAANLSGVSTEQLATGLKMLAKNAADAAGGGKEQAETFAAMGLSVRDAGGALKPVEVLLGEVADRFAGYTDGAGKSALAMRLFGKAGVEMIPLLNGGAAGLAAMQEEAKRLGIAVSTETAQAAERFNDNMSRVKGQLDAVALVLAESALPSLERLGQAMADAVQEGDDVRAGLGTIFDGAIDGALMFTTLVGDVGRGLGALGATASQFDTDTMQHPAIALWKNWVGDDSAWMRSVDIMKMWQDDSVKAWEDYWSRVSAGGSRAAAAGLGGPLMSEVPAGWENASLVPVGQTAAPVVATTGKAKKAAVYQAAEALRALNTEVRQLGMTDSQRRLDDFLALEPRTVAEIEAFQRALGAIAEDAKATATAQQRTDNMLGGWEQIAAIRAEGRDEDPLEKAREEYYERADRTADMDAEFEREWEALKKRKDLLEETKEKMAAVSVAAGQLSGTVTNILLAPLQEGFQGLKTILELLKAAFLDLIATIMQELLKGVALKFLSSMLGIPVAGESKGFLETLFGFKDGGKVEAANGFALPAFAGGGKVSAFGGPRSDGGVARVSDEEWIHQAAAGRYYGDRIMGAINSMAIPRGALQMAMGGGVLAPAMAGGGGEVHLHFASLDPLAALDLMGGVAAPALGRHLADGTAGLLASHIRTATAQPRAY